MTDTYENFEALRLAEPGAYSISYGNPGTPIIIAAPHGGGIEPGTSEIAKAIAAEDLAYYVFEGGKSSGNFTLHITSTNFDEPQGISLMRSSRIVLTVHGEESDGETVYVGGLHTSSIFALRNKLEQAGYSVQEHADPLLQGTNPRNICNIGLEHAGVQIELSRGLRKTFFESLTRDGRKNPTARFFEFCSIVKQAMAEMGDEAPAQEL